MSGCICYKLVRDITVFVQLEAVLQRAITKKEILNLKSQLSVNYISNYINESNPNRCIICKKNNRNIVILPCKHLLVCKTCIQKAYHFNISDLSKPSCPKCAVKIQCYYTLKPKKEQSCYSDCKLNEETFLSQK